MLHIIYRSYGGENKKGRPDYYSKLLALNSFLRARSALEVPAEVIYINDGPIPADRLSVMERSGEVIGLTDAGNRGSLRAGYRLPEQRGWAADDFMVLAEDDYLYLPGALNALVAAVAALPAAEYFALYASIGAVQPDGGQAPEYASVPKGWHDTEPELIQGHPWRRALSTTSSFGVRVKTMVEDRFLHEAVMWSGGAWDHSACLLYQGFPFSRQLLSAPVREPETWLRRTRGLAISATRLSLNAWQALRSTPPRLLMAADPPLTTHLTLGCMARGTDWEAVARDSEQWGREATAVPAEVTPRSTHDAPPAVVT
jgi:hypothetical protein